METDNSNHSREIADRRAHLVAQIKPIIEYMAKKSAEAMVGMSVEQQRSHIREVMTMITETTREYLQKP